MELVDSLRSDNAAMKGVHDILLSHMSDCLGRLQNLDRHAADIGGHCQLSHILQHDKTLFKALTFQSMAPAAAADGDR